MPFLKSSIFLPFIPLFLLTLGCNRGALDGCAAGSGLVATEYTGSSLAANELSFSFEDATGESWQDIVEYLYLQNAPSTFFVKGFDVKDLPDRMEAAVAQGHLIGSLGWSGENLALLQNPVVDVRRADTVLSPYASGNIYLLRSRGGWSSDVAEELNQSGLGKYVGSISMDVGWRQAAVIDDSACIAEVRTAAQCSDGYLVSIRQATKGIVNFRSTSVFTRDLLRILVPALLREGFTFTRADLIPDIKAALNRQAATPGATGKSSCDDYK